MKLDLPLAYCLSSWYSSWIIHWIFSINHCLSVSCYLHYSALQSVPLLLQKFSLGCSKYLAHHPFWEGDWCTKSSLSWYDIEYSRNYLYFHGIATLDILKAYTEKSQTNTVQTLIKQHIQRIKKLIQIIKHHHCISKFKEYKDLMTLVSKIFTHTWYI